jgi:hypothetical protein
MNILGYRPSIGELTVVVVVGILAERLARWVSRLWDFLLDKIASLSDRLRVRRIRGLEGRIEKLTEYSDRKVVLLFLHNIARSMMALAFLIMINSDLQL